MGHNKRGLRPCHAVVVISSSIRFDLKTQLNIRKARRDDHARSSLLILFRAFRIPTNPQSCSQAYSRLSQGNLNQPSLPFLL